VVVDGLSSRRSTPPFKIEGHDLGVEYGLHLKPRPTTRRFRFKFLVISLFSVLPLLWWFGNSSALTELPLQSYLFWAPTSSSTAAEPDLSATKLQAPASTIQLSTSAKSTPILRSTSTATVAQPKVPASTVVKKVDLLHPVLRAKFSSLPWLHLRLNGENLSRVFKKHRFNKTQLRQILKLGGGAKQLRQLHRGQHLHIKHDPNGNIEALVLALKDSKELHIYKEGGGFVSEIRRQGVRIETVFVHGVVESSLPVAAQKAKLSSHILAQLVEIFQWKIDFAYGVQPGDKFNVIYEQHWFEEEVKEGKMLAAEFVNQGKVYRALRYTDASGYTGYYTPIGDSLQKVSLLRAPVEYTRISSPFGKRRHPISRRYSLHNGTDYAAPWGTPIVAGGDATVKFVGRKGGYGKVITLEHNGRVLSLYAHLSKYAEDLSVGDEVIQGQIIGYVGQSGRATGPHLHYEIKLDDVAVDPQHVDLPLAMPISDEIQDDFIDKTQLLMTQLDVIGQFTKPTKLVQNQSPVMPTMANLAQSTPVNSVLREHSIDYVTNER
jgi:murein DD-endopeptidase MepM/ murein hydrolase activator NlpD